MSCSSGENPHDRRYWGLRQARIQFGGITRIASLELVPEAKVGDYVLVHVGFAISRIDEEEARQTLTDLETMARLADELGPEEAVKDAVRDDEVRR